MEALARQLLAGGPRFVSEFIAIFGGALEGEFDMENPGRTESVYLLGLYVGPQSKRHVVAYIGIGHARDRLLRIARVDYTLPVPAEGARVFGGNGRHVLPPEGPEFRYLEVHGSNPEYLDARHLIGEDIAASAARGPQHRIEPWTAEIARLEAARVAAEAEAAPLEAAAAARGSSSSSRSSSSKSKSGSGSRSSSSNSGSGSSSSPIDPALLRIRNRLRTIHNALVFWRMMYPKILQQIEYVGILAPGRATPRSPPHRTSRRYRRRASTGNASSLAVTSNSASRVRRTRRALRTAAAGAAAAATPPRAPRVGPRRLPRDPVTGKIIRQRQAYSDPRATSTNRPEPPRRPTPGRISGYEGSNDTARGRSPVSSDSEESGPPTPSNVFSERRRST